MTDPIEVRQLEAEYRVAEKAWQADVFNAEKERELGRAADRLRAAKRAAAEAEGVEYPSNDRYYAEIGGDDD